MHINGPDADSGTDNQKLAAVQKDQPRELREVVNKYYHLAQRVPLNIRDSVMKPLSEEWRLLKFYLKERKRLTEAGDMIYMLSKDRERLAKYEMVMKTILSSKIKKP